MYVRLSFLALRVSAYQHLTLPVLFFVTRPVAHVLLLFSEDGLFRAGGGRVRLDLQRKGRFDSGSTNGIRVLENTAGTHLRARFVSTGYYRDPRTTPCLNTGTEPMSASVLPLPKSCRCRFVPGTFARAADLA
jgi:hypothetical protein